LCTPGIDAITIEEFPFTFRECWPEIRATILEGNYIPSPVQRVEIPKLDGSTRPLGIPAVLHRVIQQVVALQLPWEFHRAGHFHHYLQTFFSTIWIGNSKNVAIVLYVMQMISSL